VRVLPEGLAATLDRPWDRGPVYAWLDDQGVPEEEQRRVFNLGIGMCAVIPEADVGPDDLVIGRLEPGDRAVNFL
jgi:phosphoribosylformylglycinamidine cyclo-ligase